jgi:hypothetical protein
VVVLVAVLAVVGGMAAGLAPGVFALGTDVQGSLKASSSGGLKAGARMRVGLLAAQSALCMVLLSLGGGFLQSFRRAAEFDRGFDPERLITLNVPAYVPNADEEFARVTERVRSLPDVEAAGRNALGGLSGDGLLAMVGKSSRDTVGEGRGATTSANDRSR